MSKEKDLMRVFNFISDYLREEETTTNVEPEINEPQEIDVKSNQHPDYQILGVSSRDVLELIKKIENIDKQRAEVNSIIKERDKSYVKEIKRMKEEHEELVKTLERKTSNEDSLSQSASTVTNSNIFVVE